MKFAIAALASIALAATPAVAEMPGDAAIRQILADRIDRDAANVGIAVAVIEDGVARFVSHGTLAGAGSAAVDAHTVFEAGSITKVMTNLLLAQMVADGQIDLDAPLTDYLPAGTVLPERDGKAITAFDLATHSAGFSGLPEALLARGGDNPYSGFDAAALFDWIGSYQLTRGIGEQFEYSNVGTALLAQAITHVSGQDFATLLQSRILDPLDMDETSLALAPGPVPQLATGHDAGGAPVLHWDFDAFAPAGALRTTATDLAKFIAAASGTADGDFGRAAFDLMLARMRPAGGGDEKIGLGWFILPTADSDIVWHNGITGGFRSFAGFERGSGDGVVVLSNMVTTAGIEDIGLHLLDEAIPLRAQPERRAVAAIDPAILPAYAGDYLLAPGVTISVTTEGAHTYAQLTGQQKFEIFPESERRFFFRVVDAQITFSDPLEGAAPALILHQNGQNMTAIRLP